MTRILLGLIHRVSRFTDYGSKSEHDRFPLVAYGWENKHPILDKTSSLLAKKELKSGATQTNIYPTSISVRGHDFTSCQPGPPHLRGSGHTRALRSHA
jgi:hypothetical protein